MPRALSFDVIDGTDAFLRLESTSANKPITLEPEKEILLLSSHEIPALIVEHMAPFPLVVSYIPGKAAHVIAELQAPQHTLSEIIDCFFPCVGLGVSKLVIIKKLTCANDLKPSVKSETFTDVILFNGVPTPAQLVNGVRLTHDHATYTMVWDNQNPPPPDLAKGLIQNKSRRLSLPHLPALYAQEPAGGIIAVDHIVQALGGN